MRDYKDWIKGVFEAIKKSNCKLILATYTKAYTLYPTDFFLSKSGGLCYRRGRKVFCTTIPQVDCFASQLKIQSYWDFMGYKF